MHLLLSEDERVIVIGEDVADPYGGAFKVTRGLSTLYPDQVITTPISEGAITGIAAGMAVRGFKPVAEIMFGDFLTLAADQLINHAAKFNFMYNETVSVPLVIRTPMGGRRGYGPTHSQSLEKHFLGVPGLTVVAVNSATDAGELLVTAVKHARAPVLFIENKHLYTLQTTTHLSGWNLERLGLCDETDTFPTIVLRQQFAPASDALIFTYGGMTPLCIEALIRLHETEGLNCDLAVFSQLSPVPTGHLRSIMTMKALPSVCAYAEEASVESGWGAEMIASVEMARQQLGMMAPLMHVRIGADHTPIPASRGLENAALPQIEDIVMTLVNCF